MMNRVFTTATLSTALDTRDRTLLSQHGYTPRSTLNSPLLSLRKRLPAVLTYTALAVENVHDRSW